MKKVLIILLFVVLLGGLFFFVYKKKSDVEKIQVQGVSVSLDIHNIGDVLELFKEAALNGITANCIAEIYNFSNGSFNIDSVYIEIFNKDVNILKQTQTVPNIAIKPGLNQIKIPVTISTIGARSLGINIENAFPLAQNYMKTGKIGKTLTVSGYVVYHGITVKINQEIEI